LAVQPPSSRAARVARAPVRLARRDRVADRIHRQGAKTPRPAEGVSGSRSARARVRAERGPKPFWLGPWRPWRLGGGSSTRHAAPKAPDVTAA
jgi:hypothetical protein